MRTLNQQELKTVSGGLLPLVVYGGAILLGAAIGAAYSAIQGYKEARNP